MSFWKLHKKWTLTKNSNFSSNTGSTVLLRTVPRLTSDLTPGPLPSNNTWQYGSESPLVPQALSPTQRSTFTLRMLWDLTKSFSVKSRLLRETERWILPCSQNTHHTFSDILQRLVDIRHSLGMPRLWESKERQDREITFEQNKKMQNKCTKHCPSIWIARAINLNRALHVHESTMH